MPYSERLEDDMKDNIPTRIAVSREGEFIHVEFDSHKYALTIKEADRFLHHLEQEIQEYEQSLTNS